ncbi:MAG: hypothetical protein HYW48_01950 [Deltaproteobacteria bacterium]|nr:hypothetical protein [Deltaproteobacteria bacterium]
MISRITAFSLALLLPLSCKERESTPVELKIEPVEKQTVEVARGKIGGLALVDANSLTVPKLQVSKVQVCDSEAMKIMITGHDPRTDAFQFVLCNSSDPTQCSPSESESVTFAETELTFPNTSQGDIPLVRIRPCVRSYNAQDPASLCTPNWDEAKLEMAIAKGGNGAQDLLAVFQGEQKITKLCWQLRDSIVTYLANADDTEKGDLRTLLDSNVAIGVDLCRVLIANYYLNIAEDELALEEQPGSRRSTTFTSDSKEEEDEDKEKTQKKWLLTGVIGLLTLGSIAATVTAVGFTQKRINSMQAELKTLPSDPVRMATLKEEIAKLEGLKGTETVDDKIRSLESLLGGKTPEQKIVEIKTMLGPATEKRVGLFNELKEKIKGSVDGTFRLTYGQVRKLGYGPELIAKWAGVTEDVAGTTLRDKPNTVINRDFRPDDMRTPSTTEMKYNNRIEAFKKFPELQQLMKADTARATTSKKIQQFETAKKAGVAGGVGLLAAGVIIGAFVQSYGLAGSAQEAFINELQAIRQEIETVQGEIAAANLRLESCSE